MKEFTVLSGESYSVMADTEEEALEKFFAYNDGENCERHNFEECECIQYVEAMTVVI
jgi:hypothetical protein